MGRSTGEVAIVTGGGSGMGSAICMAFAEEGYKVAVVDIDASAGETIRRKITSLDGIAIYVKADVSKEEEVNQMIQTTLEAFGQIDVLVNNAGIFYRGGIEETKEADWDKVIDVNLKGVFLCSKAVIKQMKKQNSGKIINIASIAGKTGGIFSGANYVVSKAGVIAFTKRLAKEMGPYGVNVNAIAPGSIDTPMVRAMPAEETESLVTMIPLGRIGQPEDVANAALFLISKKAAYITGVTLHVDGGLYMD